MRAGSTTHAIWCMNWCLSYGHAWTWYGTSSVSQPVGAVCTRCGAERK
jgi:hypothetical protein